MKTFKEAGKDSRMRGERHSAVFHTSLTKKINGNWLLVPHFNSITRFYNKERVPMRISSQTVYPFIPLTIFLKLSSKENDKSLNAQSE